MISVIVPVYKAENVIARCIESVIAQEYQDWELILVDDGSPDRSGTICDGYALKYEKIRVVHQENAGASAARNHGIDVARGEYICFIDADDYVAGRYLTDFKIEEVEVDFSIQGMTLTFEEESRNHNKLPSFSGLHSLSELLSQNECTLDLLNGPCCKLYRADIIREQLISFPVGLSYGEDSIFVLEYLIHCRKVYAAPVSNYCYTHENTQSLSSTRQNGYKMMAAVIQDFNLFQKLSSRVGDLPDTYIEYYRDYKALMFYNAIYNELLSDEPLDLKVDFLLSIPEVASVFFKQSDNLPKTYNAIRILLRVLPKPVVPTIFSWINKVRQ